MTDDTSPDQPTPAAEPRTLRRGLRDRRQAALDKLHLDRRVPRLDPPVFVRFKPLEDDQLDAARKAIEKGKNPRRSVIANANALASACIGIYELDDAGDQVPVFGVDVDAWQDSRFDEKLAAALEMPVNTRRAADVVQALYLTDGDIISEAGELTEWSGYVKRDGDEDWSGN